MRAIFILFLSLLITSVCYSQKKKDKHFKDGYIIRLSDTVRCKIYVGALEKICHEVTFQYPDGRQMTYTAGSAIKGFGYKTDSSEKHYLAFPISEYYINGQKNTKAYGEVIAPGQLRLLKYAAIYPTVRATRRNPGLGVTTATDIRYYLYPEKNDTAIRVGFKRLIGYVYFTKDEIKTYIADYRELMEEIKEEDKISLKELAAYIDSYNQWKEKTKTIQQ
jgi:hypothetical protein